MPKIDFVIEKFPTEIYNTSITSNLYKILSAMSVELDTFLVQMENVKNSRFIDYAVGLDLDKIGAIINVHRFSSENDLSYRGRIKTTIPSFIGGGTISSIKQVIKSFLGVDAVVIEHYKPYNGHALFDNGVLNGLSTIITSGLNLQVKLGTSYINGVRITSINTNLTATSSSEQYIKLNSNGTVVIQNNNTLTNQILIAKITSNTTTITNIADLRFVLDPFEHYITNTASITVQIPYNFVESLITIEDVKNVIIKTRSAGIAMLINVVGAYEDSLHINEIMDFGLLVGFSNVGSANYFGGQ
jgi:hypothetical protein